MEEVLNITTIIYNIAFIVLTISSVSIAWWALKNQKKPVSLSARINYNLDGSNYISGKGHPVTLDIINHGDAIAENVQVEFRDSGGVEFSRDKINFIGAGEIYSHCLGYYNNQSIEWLSNYQGFKSNLGVLFQPELYTVQCKNQKEGLRKVIRIVEVTCSKLPD